MHYPEPQSERPMIPCTHGACRGKPVHDFRAHPCVNGVYRYDLQPEDHDTNRRQQSGSSSGRPQKQDDVREPPRPKQCDVRIIRPQKQGDVREQPQQTQGDVRERARGTDSCNSPRESCNSHRGSCNSHGGSNCGSERGTEDRMSTTMPKLQCRFCTNRGYSLSTACSHSTEKCTKICRRKQCALDNPHPYDECTNKWRCIHCLSYHPRKNECDFTLMYRAFVTFFKTYRVCGCQLFEFIKHGFGDVFAPYGTKLTPDIVAAVEYWIEHFDEWSKVFPVPYAINGCKNQCGGYEKYLAHKNEEAHNEKPYDGPFCYTPKKMRQQTKRHTK